MLSLKMTGKKINNYCSRPNKTDCIVELKETYVDKEVKYCNIIIRTLQFSQKQFTTSKQTFIKRYKSIMKE